MIKTEIFKKLSDETILVRTYSTTGMMIERDGIKYSEAIDDASLGYTYMETDITIEGESATEEDYLHALGRLGVTDD